MIKNPNSIEKRLLELVGKKVTIVSLRSVFSKVILKKEKTDTYFISENRGKFKITFNSKDVKYIYLDDKHKINIRLKDG